MRSFKELTSRKPEISFFFAEAVEYAISLLKQGKEDAVKIVSEQFKIPEGEIEEALSETVTFERVTGSILSDGFLHEMKNWIMLNGIELTEQNAGRVLDKFINESSIAPKELVESSDDSEVREMARRVRAFPANIRNLQEASFVIFDGILYEVDAPLVEEILKLRECVSDDFDTKLMESSEEFSEMLNFISEAAKIYWAVTSKGQKVRKIVCQRGQMKRGSSCVAQSSKMKMARRRAAQKATRTRRSHKSQQRMANRKRAMTLRRRKSLGL